MKQFCRLSPIDHAFTGKGAYPIEFMFYYPNGLDVSRLQIKLDSLSSIFWPVFGKLEESVDQLLKVSWTGEKATIIEEDWRDRDMPDFSDPKDVAKFSTPVDSEVGKDLAAFKVFHLKQGSALAVNISHCIVDGYSYFLFMWHWSTMCQKFSLSNKTKRSLSLPVHDRSLLTPKEVDQDPAVDNETCFQKTGFSLHSSPREFSWDDCQWKFYRYPVSDVKQILSDFNSSEQRVSVNDVLCAMLLKDVLAKENFFNEEAVISSAFDYRRIIRSLGKRYFGNAVRTASFKLATEELSSMSIGDLALQVGRTNRSIKEKEAWESLSYMEGLRLKKSTWEIPIVQGARVADPNNGILMTNLSRVPEIDFGSGPAEVVVILTPAPRSAVITKANEDFVVRLSPPAKT